MSETAFQMGYQNQNETDQAGSVKNNVLEPVMTISC